ncbi:MAG: DUF5803 family protein [Methanotrichaceae archaeon]
MSRYLLGTGALLLLTLIFISIVSADEFNGTTYRLTSNQMEVTQPVDASALNLTLPEKAINMSLLDFTGRSIGLKESYTFWRGDYIYRIIFDQHVSGKLVYTLPHQGQNLALPIKENKNVRIILPPGYTTGDRFFGIALPNPDNIRIDKDVTELTWRNVSVGEVIDVSYYKSNAPEIVRTVFIAVAIASLILFADYYASIRRLRSLRNKDEKSLKH